MMVSCGGDDGNSGDTGDTGDTGNTGNTGATCTGSDKFCHSHDGLNWSDASSDYMIWDDAVTYCENLGGRLPTISELRTLIQNCPATETGGGCGVTDECLSYDDCYNEPSCFGCELDASGKCSVFGDTDWFWSSSELSGYADNAWRVCLGSGYVSYNDKGDYLYNVRCVK